MVGRSARRLPSPADLRRAVGIVAHVFSTPIRRLAPEVGRTATAAREASGGGVATSRGADAARERTRPRTGRRRFVTATADRAPFRDG